MQLRDITRGALGISSLSARLLRGNREQLVDALLQTYGDLAEVVGLIAKK